MAAIESDQDYRELESVLPELEGGDLRAAQRELGRYRSLNPHVGVKADGIDSIKRPEQPSAIPVERVEATEAAEPVASAEEYAGAERAHEQLPQEVRDAEQHLSNVSQRQRFRQLFPDEHIELAPGESRMRADAENQLLSAQRSIPNASKDPALFVPPEYMPEGHDVGSILNAERFFEPSFVDFLREQTPKLVAAGIDPRTLDEDSPEYQRFADAKWAETYVRAKTAGVPVVRDAYKQDSTWQEKTATALARGADAISGTLGGVAGGVLPGSDVLISRLDKDAREGMNRAAGLPPPVVEDSIANAQERHPELNMVGTVAGAAAPGSVGSRLAGGAYRSLAPAGAGFARRVLAAGFAGGLAGLGTAVGNTAGELVAGEDRTGEEVSQRAAGEVAGGVVGGVVGELLGSAAKYAVDDLRGPSRLGDKITLAEKAGYETSALHKMKPSPELAEAQAATGERHPYIAMAEDVAEKGAQTAHDLQAQTNAEMGKRVEKYYSWSDVRPETHRAPVRTIDRTIDLIRSMRSDEGDVGFLNSAPLRKELTKMVRVRLMPADDVQAALAASPKSKAYPVDELLGLGFSEKELNKLAQRGAPEMEVLGYHFDPEATMNARVFGKPQDSGDVVRQGLEPWTEIDIPGEPGDFIPNNYKVVLDPVPISPRQFDKQVQRLDALAGAARVSTGGKAEPMYQQLTEASHADREAFPPHPTFANNNRVYEISGADGKTRKVRGWAALKAQHYETKLQQEAVNEAAGFPREIPNRVPQQVGAPKGEEVVPPKLVAGKPLPSLNQEQWNRVQDVVANLHSPGNERALLSKRAWEYLANEGGFAQELDRVAGTRYGEEIRNGGEGLRGVIGSSFRPSLYTSFGEGARLRLDPSLRALSSVPTDDPAKLVGPNLRRLLGLLRRGQKPAPRPPGAVTLGQQMFGLRGGQLGARAAAAQGEREDELTDEDLENLRRLMEARKAAE